MYKYDPHLIFRTLVLLKNLGAVDWHNLTIPVISVPPQPIEFITCNIVLGPQ